MECIKICTLIKLKQNYLGFIWNRWRNKMANKTEKNETFTSLKIGKALYDEFKIATIKSDFNLKKFVNMSMHKFVNNDNFQTHMNEYLEKSGSII